MLGTGGFLTLLAVAFSLRTTPPVQAVSQNEKAVSVEEEVGAAQTVAATGVAPAVAAALPRESEPWDYIDRPASASSIEAALATPADEIYYVKVDQTRLAPGASVLRQEGARIDMTLPSGEVVPVVMGPSELLGPDRYIAEAGIEGSEHGRAVFAYNEGELSASIDDLELGSWQVRSVGDSVAQVFKVNDTLVPPCGVDGHAHSTATQAATSEPAVDLPGAPAPAMGAVSGNYARSITGSWPLASLLSGTTTEIRVLVPFSKSLLKSHKESAVRSQIDLAMAVTNDNLKRSGVNLRVRLAGAPSVQYNQENSGSSSTVLDNALKHLSSSVDGVLDNIHVQRGEAQADVVVLLLGRADSNNSGIGYILARPGDAFNATWAFSVVNYSYMLTGGTFTHEIGHNLGCNHDRGNARTTTGVSMGGSYSYSYGHRFKGSNGSTYRTIMAYAPGGVVPYFSNPKIKVNGAAAGVETGRSGEAYNALTIQKNAAEVSNYSGTRAVQRTMRRLRGY